MSTYGVDIEDLPKLMMEHELARQESILDAMEVAAERARTRAIKETPVDHGDMRKGWKVKRLTSAVEMRNDFPYSEIIELGRRPGQTPPPLAPIMEWVARHEDSFGPFGLPIVNTETGEMTERKGATLSDGTELDAYQAHVRDIAILVRSKIGAEGTEGRFIIAGNLNLFTKWLKQEIKAELAEGP